MLERKVGEFFTVKDSGKEQEYLVCKGNYGCINCCAFCFTRQGGCESPDDYTGVCQNFYRSDKTDVHFVRVIRENGMIGLVIPLGQRRALGWGNLCGNCNNDLGREVSVYSPLLNDLYSLSCFKEVSKCYNTEDEDYQYRAIQQFAEFGYKQAE